MTAALLSNVIALTHAYFFHKHLMFKSRARAAVGEYLPPFLYKNSMARVGSY